MKMNFVKAIISEAFISTVGSASARRTALLRDESFTSIVSSASAWNNCPFGFATMVVISIYLFVL